MLLIGKPSKNGPFSIAILTEPKGTWNKISEPWVIQFWWLLLAKNCRCFWMFLALATAWLLEFLASRDVHPHNCQSQNRTPFVRGVNVRVLWCFIYVSCICSPKFHPFLFWILWGPASTGGVQGLQMSQRRCFTSRTARALIPTKLETRHIRTPCEIMHHN